MHLTFKKLKAIEQAENKFASKLYGYICIILVSCQGSLNLSSYKPQLQDHILSNHIGLLSMFLVTYIGAIKCISDKVKFVEVPLECKLKVQKWMHSSNKSINQYI